MERWKIDENETLPLAIIVDDENGEGVCEIGAPGTESATESQENWNRALLIAAAPRLRDALSQLMDRLDEHGSIDHIREEGPIAEARTALATLKGE